MSDDLVRPIRPPQSPFSIDADGDIVDAITGDWEHAVKTATEATAKELRRQAAAIRAQGDA